MPTREADYKAAARIVFRCVVQRQSERELVFAAKNPGLMKALAGSTLKNVQALFDAASAAELLDARELRSMSADDALRLVLVRELLHGAERELPAALIASNHVARDVASAAERIRSSSSSSSTSKSSSAAAAATAVLSLPKYMRFSPLAGVSFDDALAQLRADFGDDAVTVDAHVPQLLALPARADLHAHSLVTRGALVPQDKASCLSALALAPPADAVVVDACAAPGNKTTQLAAAVGSGGRVVAVDRDATRLGTLAALATRTHIDSRIARVCADFLQLTGDDDDDDGGGGGGRGNDVATRRLIGRATHALVDPSCSGSGLATRWDYAPPAAAAASDAQWRAALVAAAGARDPELARRLRQLSAFQATAVLHALRLPRVTRVVYSTCSVHVEENEYVVRRVLADANKASSAVRVRVAPVLSAWPRRGVVVDGLDAATARACVRTRPERDATNGFFVACFEVTERRARAGPLAKNTRQSTTTTTTTATTTSKKRQKRPRPSRVPVIKRALTER